MSRTISCTCTVGDSSERHNHDLDYRAGLKHVHGSAEDVIELIPYRSYQEQINEMMKSYIVEYNQRQQQRYKEAWHRYNNGEIKTKPRKRNYEPMGYDYYSDHLNDIYYNRAHKKNEAVKLWRGLIFGLSDKADRENGIITKAEAIGVMSGVVKRWPEIFPCLKLLGATIHLDEDGFYHCHIDYIPFIESGNDGKHEHGLRASHSQEAAFMHMGFEPEQSIINASDKAPIRFNAFRNRLYLTAEEELNAQGLRLQYGVSKIKEPAKEVRLIKEWKTGRIHRIG